MKRIKGVIAAEGFASAKAFVLDTNRFTGNRKIITADRIEGELAAFRSALQMAVDEVKFLQEKAYSEGSREQGDIFDAYLEILDDEELYNDTADCIKEKLVDLTTALMDVCNEYAADMAALDDPYMQARADDFRQIFGIILDMHSGKCRNSIAFAEDFILTAAEVGVADMAKIDKKFLKGIVVETGSRTSHAAIVCRSAGIPMLSGIQYEQCGIVTGTELILDGEKGELFIEPESSVKAEYDKKITSAVEEKKRLQAYRDKKGVTANNISVSLVANAGTVAELDAILENNADGIGLFRTEFLFMENPRRLPGEEEQFNAYKTVLTRMKDKPVVFRTLDAGGDKNIAALGIPKEENPFLGWRAVRYCLKTPEIFRTQLRALVRASCCGNCEIMIPMISTENELLQVKRMLESVYEELEEKDGKKINRVPFGIMVETPAAALIADTLARHVDFFSLGTNDLTQYTVAVDRGNEYVSELYDEMHPAVLKLIELTVGAANKAGIKVHICGEMAGDVRCTEALLKAGLRELSMSANRIPYIKEHLLTLHI
ncbi:phosphoenolpyruvate--protein phosphotransferase [Treponema sp.]|uniref:phosphoenolpyruvate--protein phosphotransferase n=1 Tax=Treponema sp. TaxID=166 RepID=UPI003FA1FB80